MHGDELFQALEHTFMEEGLVGGKLMEVIDAEKAYRPRIIEAHRKYIWATDCFGAFWLDTLQTAERDSKAVRTDEKYRYILLAMTTNWRRYRAAEVIVLNGYPTTAYGLLRDLVDSCLGIWAIANRIVSCRDIMGLPDTDPAAAQQTLSFKLLSKRRKKAQRRILEGVANGLDSATADQIKKWYEMFHQEVHGNYWTLTLECQEYILQDGNLPILPRYDKKSAEWYMCTSVAVEWLWLRLLPFLQHRQGQFPKSWAEKWRVLDDHFKMVNDSIGGDGGPLRAAIASFVELKFNVDPASAYCGTINGHDKWGQMDTRGGQ